MELVDYLRILTKRGWIAVLVAVIAAVTAFAVSKMQTPVYSASVKLSVNPARADWGLSNTTKDLLRNYAENIRTHKMAQEVIDRAQLDMDTTTLLGKLFVSPAADTFTLQIEARDTDPQVAMTIAQTMAEVFVEDRDAWNQRQDKRDRIEVSILDSVWNLGYQQYSPNTRINTVAGGLAGLLVGLLVVFFLEWLEQDVIRTDADLERAVQVTVLGVIPPVVLESGVRATEGKLAAARRGA
ncbi:MAG: Wzz/FepE/Etk N-terminal domain-containing protein [Anaerolineae bacterium]|nr:Wzz/FepE/Etk N-terminal domain-containing protein [Anaerolineae bacterium]MDW8070020.1 Wzz/FepE/Etk N-terminal domain-containing protein [Anaerolineae bacterium]